MNTATVRDTQVHSFKLSEPLPLLQNSPSKAFYWAHLRWRVILFGIAIFSALLLSLMSLHVELGSILSILPAILAGASILGSLQDVEKAKKEWRQEQAHAVFYSSAAEEIRDALSSVEELYPARDGRLMDFREAFSFYRDFMLLRPWEDYLASVSPSARERRRRRQEGGFSSNITSDSWWSFTPRFLDPHTYELTVERYENTPPVQVN